jgi:endogenous inhibitor of DNA gyrase (YacG/DUF329 family)
MTIEDTMNTRTCARCGVPLEAPARSGRPRRWCSQRCRRAAYEERKAAAAGAVAVRVVEVERAEKAPAKPTVDEAIKIVLGSQQAWRTVLAELTHRAEEGAFDRWGGHECDLNNLAAVRFTNALVAYHKERVYEELLRQRRSWDERWSRWYGPGPGLAAARSQDRDDLG